MEASTSAPLLRGSVLQGGGPGGWPARGHEFYFNRDDNHNYN